MQTAQRHEPDSDLPSALAKPARRALTRAGYARLDQLARVSEAEIAGLHGMGPRALSQIRQALAEKGLSFSAD
jgi:DNA-directed RNA polymerase alpha subunit